MLNTKHTADGIRTEFSFDFPVLSARDVFATVNGISKPILSVMTNADLSGGSVKFETPPPSGAQVVLYRQVDLTDAQPTFSDDAVISAERLNVELMMILEAIRDTRAVSLNAGEAASIYDKIVAYIEAKLVEIKESIAPTDDWGSVSEPVKVR